MKLAIEIIKREIAQRELAQKHDHLRKDEVQLELESLNKVVKKLTIPVVMPRISHFIDENGTAVDLNAEGVNVRLKRDGTHEYSRSFGFAGRKELTPVYGA